MLFSSNDLQFHFFSSKAQFLELSNCSNSATARTSVSCFNKVVDLHCPLSIPITDSRSHWQASSDQYQFHFKTEPCIICTWHLASMHTSTNWTSNFNPLPGAPCRLFWRFQHLVMPSPALLKHPISLKSHISWTIPGMRVIHLPSLTFPPALHKISPTLRQLCKFHFS